MLCSWVFGVSIGVHLIVTNWLDLAIFLPIEFFLLLLFLQVEVWVTTAILEMLVLVLLHSLFS